MGQPSVPLEHSGELSREIASTRRRIEERADLLRDRVSPKELVRPVVDRLRDTLGAGGEKLLDAFRDNPIPMTLAGIGLGWLLLRDRSIAGRRGPRPRVPEPEGPATEGAAPESGVAHQMRESAKKSTQETIEWFERTLDRNPLVLTVGALAAGMVAGLVLPVRDPEETTAGKPGEEPAPARPGTPPFSGPPAPGSPPEKQIQSEGDRPAPSSSSVSMG